MSNGQSVPVFESEDTNGEIIAMRWIKLMLIALIIPFSLLNPQRSNVGLVDPRMKRLRNHSQEWSINQSECLACRMVDASLFLRTPIHGENDVSNEEQLHTDSRPQVNRSTTLATRPKRLLIRPSYDANSLMKDLMGARNSSSKKFTSEVNCIITRCWLMRRCAAQTAITHTPSPQGGIP